MSQTTITFSFDGNAGELTLLSLGDPTSAFGVQRQDTLATVVNAGTVMVSDGGGSYHYTFTDPAPGLVYTCWIHWVYAGESRFNQLIKRGGGDLLPRYVEGGEADALAATLPGLTAWAAASATQRYMALAMATSDIETAMRFQGRKYDLLQPLSFPRVAYEPSRTSDPYLGTGINGTVGPLINNGLRGGAVVWDWDPVALVAVVPPPVRIAAIYQADSLLAGKRAKLIDQLHNGLTSQSIGSGSESYDLAAAMKAGGLTLALCRQASQLMSQYRIRQGMFL